ncbi:hypothetical protein F5141DRAFT_1065552 [Pisolithus sp. B1]|nr:hypothetical protein F5141DRAFT_1065552 [Pisolithus sp. B1]
MPPKSLSTTTLALRFMKNGAHRQVEQQKVELEQAHVKDDAKWEVSEEVRRAWEVVHGGDEDRKHVTYEQSYLPFLFPSLSDGQNGKVGGHERKFHAGMKLDIGDDDGEEWEGGDETRDTGTQNTVSLLPRGRRTFDKHGREVVQTTSTPDETSDIPASKDVATADPPIATAKKLGRLKSISSFGKPQSSKKGKEKTSDEGTEIDKEKHERDLSKAAKNVIRDISGVGTDLRAQRPSRFMKPQGVDAPVRVNVKEEDGSSASVPPATADVTLTRRTRMKRVGDTARLEERDGPRTKKKPKLGTVE